MHRTTAPFTFIEVLIAAALFGVAAATVLGILGSARSGILRAEVRWGRQHVMSQALEYYLMAGAEADEPPAGMLPQGFSSRCELVAAADLPEHAEEAPPKWKGWRLGEYHVSVEDNYGNQIDSWMVQKIVHDDDLF